MSILLCVAERIEGRTEHLEQYIYRLLYSPQIYRHWYSMMQQEEQLQQGTPDAASQQAAREAIQQQQQLQWQEQLRQERLHQQQIQLGRGTAEPTIAVSCAAASTTAIC